MSRRTRRETERPPNATASGPRPERRPRSWRSFARGLAGDVLILAVAFAAGVVLAELLGAANLGTAFGIGQIAFVLALVRLLLRRS